MSDPASVLGTAVGVISLGIQVCQSLLTYYERWKSFDDDIVCLHDNIDELKTTLENLEHILPKFRDSNVNIMTDVEKKIVSSFNGIRKLEDVLAKCHYSSVSANIVQQKGYRFLQKTFYPFKKATLQELNHNVINLEHRLKTSLQSLMLDATGDQRQLVMSTSRVAQEEMREVKGEIKSINANMSVVGEGIPEILHRIDAIQNGVLNISSTLEARLDNLRLRTYQQTVLPELGENHVTLRSDDHINQIVETFQTLQLNDAQRSGEIQKCVRPIRTVQARLLEKPSLLRDVCDEISHNGGLIQLPSIKNSHSVLVDASSRPFFKRPTCTCRSSTYSIGFQNPGRLRYSRRMWSGRLNAFNLSHRKDCELFKPFKKETSLHLKLMYYSGVIAGVVNASFQLTRGAGAFSLSPSLSCIRVVPHKSPAFELITLHMFDIVCPGILLTSDVVIWKLRELFQDGRASPGDVNPDGQSLLHVASSQIGRSQIENVAKDEVSYFLKNLCRLGVPVNEVANDGKTFLDELEDVGMRYIGLLPDSVDLSQRMLSFGAEYGNLDVSDYYLNTFWYAAKAAKITELAEATNYNELCKAVLSRSESRLLAAIENHSDQINQPSFLQLRPLHLSVEWPYGIKTLLKYGADVYVTDQMKQCPIAHAVGRACSKSLDIFEKAGFVSLICGRLELAMKMETQASSIDDRLTRASIVDRIIKTEANRRRKLQSLLTDYLPEGVYRSLSFCQDRLLDEQAPIARAALEQHNVSIPACLRSAYDSGTVYHYAYRTVRVLDAFWEAGFRDVNGLDSRGRNPLMTMGFENSDFEKAVEILTWFADKGVDRHEKVHHLHQNSSTQVDSELRNAYRDANHTVLHYICCGLSNILASFFIYHLEYHRSTTSKGAQVLLGRIVDSDIPDGCICACSLGGCQGLHMLLKRFFQILRNGWRFVKILEALILPSSFFYPDGMVSNEMFSKIVRLWTFEMLKLTHTCCQVERWSDYDRMIFDRIRESPERDEIDEIQEEEKEDLQLLEELVDEFEQQWEKMGHPPEKDFINEYWSTRMKEVLSERKPMDYDKIREIGVVLHEPNPDAEIDRYTRVETEDEDEDGDQNVDEDTDADDDDDQDHDQFQDAIAEQDQDQDEIQDEDHDEDQVADADTKDEEEEVEEEEVEEEEEGKKKKKKKNITLDDKQKHS